MKHVLQISVFDGITMLSSTCELVVSLLLINTIRIQRLMLADVFLRSPPDFDVLEIIYYDDVFVHAQDNGFIVLKHFCSEPVCSIGGVGAEEPLDGCICFASLNLISFVFMKSDLNIRIHVITNFVNILFNMITKLRR